VPIVGPFFRLLDEGQFEGITSPVTLAECLVKPKQSGLMELQQSFIGFLIPVLFCKTTDGWPEVLARQGKSNRQSKIQNPKLV